MGVDCLPYIRKHVSHALRWYRTAEAALQDAQDRVNGDIGAFSSHPDALFMALTWHGSRRRRCREHDVR
jgi:hypothetical protein